MLSKKEGTRQSKIKGKRGSQKLSKWRGSRQVKRNEEKARRDSGNSATGKAEGRTKDKTSVNGKITAEDKAGFSPGVNTGKNWIAQGKSEANWVLSKHFHATLIVSIFLKRYFYILKSPIMYASQILFRKIFVMVFQCF